ncbi:MAG: oligosaccharide flippase family protein, partial [Myxococcales bacterium]|nr:oligosaccharide flippase family protein [Myxococcales bacterium]
MTEPHPVESAAAERRPALRRRVLRGAALGLGGHAGSQAMRLASNLILARLLFPEAFGVMALAWLVVNGVTMLSDVGVSSSVVRDDRG